MGIPNKMCIFGFRRSNLLTFTRCRHTHNQEIKNNETQKIASDVMNFLENNSEYAELKDQIPKYLLRKYKTPESMYLINKTSAEHIARTIKSSLINCSTIVEVNPGFCFLTKELLQWHKGKIYMYETTNYFINSMNEINKIYPKQVEYKMADFFGMWKLAFQDKMDPGNRVKDLLGHLATEQHDRVLKIVGAMPGLTFMKYLLMTILFHNTTNLLGRPDLFITIPAHHYEFLTNSEIQQCKHRSLPALFQLLFDYKVLGKVPKVHYLPWIHSSNNKQTRLMTDYYMYIVNITQKKDLPCHSKYLPLLWYFFRPHMVSKKTRVIPMLEQWIPGCGVWLITGQDPLDTNKNIGPTEKDAPLPHMTIFTEFGDLNLSQKITIFKKFISWPEFEQCPFRVTMENNLPKFITALDDAKERGGTHVDGDDSDDDNSDNEKT